MPSLQKLGNMLKQLRFFTVLISACNKDQVIPIHLATTNQVIPIHSPTTDQVILIHSATTDQTIPIHSATTDQVIPIHSATTDQVIPIHSATTDQVFFFFCVRCDDRAKSSGRWLLGSPPSACSSAACPQSLVPTSVSSGQNCWRTVSRCGQV